MDRSDESLDSLLDENGPRKLNASRSWRQFLLKSPIIPWILTAIFCSSTLFLSWRLHNSQSFSCAAADGSSPLDGVNACPAECQSTSTELAIRDTYETGFQTDFGRFYFRHGSAITDNGPSSRIMEPILGHKHSSTALCK